MFQVRHSMKFFQHLLKKGLCLFNAPERVYIWFQQQSTAVEIGKFNLVFSEQDSWLLVATHLMAYQNFFLLLQQGHLWKRSCLQPFRLTIMYLFFHPLTQCMLDSSHPFNTLDFRGWCLLPFSKSSSCIFINRCRIILSLEMLESHKQGYNTCLWVTSLQNNLKFYIASPK